MKQPILCLKEIPLFEGLSTSEFNEICPGVINKSVNKGHFYFGREIMMILFIW